MGSQVDAFGSIAISPSAGVRPTDPHARNLQPFCRSADDEFVGVIDIVDVAQRVFWLRAATEFAGFIGQSAPAWLTNGLYEFL